MTRILRVSVAVAGALVAAVAVTLLLSWSIESVQAASGTVYVAPPPGGSDSNPCSLAQPCATVQHAVDVAAPGVEIHVATGVYSGVHARTGVTQVVYISRPLAIRGGFSVDFSVRDPLVYPTTLDAEGQGRVMYLDSAAAGTTLDGLRITGGNAIGADDGSIPIPGSGGGILAGWAHSITVAASQITSNTASYGGGVFLHMSHNAELVSNDISGNTATGSGGGIAIQYSQGITLTDNHVFNNVARQHSGGGIHLYDTDGAVLAGNEVISSTADDWGGGVYFSHSTGVTMINNVIAGTRGASALTMHGSGDSHLLHTTVARNTVRNAGVFLSEGTYWLTNTILVSHTVGIWTQPRTTATLTATLWGTGTWANDADWTVNGALITGSLNWWKDPGFVDPDDWDYHIGAGSGALDRGIDAGVSTDIDDEPRTVGPPDLGADEYWPPVLVERAYMPLALRNYP